MPAQTVNCVTCGQPMKKINVQAGVEIDCCDAHGVWLDINEMDAILRHAAQNTASSEPSMLAGLGQQLVSGAVSGAGWGAGTTIASTLVRRLFG